MRLVLHIGTPKTGTSALQRFLAMREADLAARGVHYLDAGRGVGGKVQERQIGFRFAFEPPGRAATGMMAQVGLDSEVARAAYARDFIRDCDAELAAVGAAGAGICVISDEALFSFPRAATLEGLKAFVDARFAQVDILCFLKEPAAYLSGGYSQSIKMGGTEGFAAYLTRRLDSGIFLRPLDRWKAAFGRDRITLKVLEGDVVAQFAAFLDRDLGWDPEKTGPARTNPSLSPTGLRLLREVNRICADEGRSRPGRLRAGFEKSATGAPWRCDPGTAAAIRARAWPELAGLLEGYDLSEGDRARLRGWAPGPAPASGAPDIDTAPPEDLREAARIILALG